MKGNTKMKKDNSEKRGRTVYLNKKQTPDAAKWVRWLEDNCQASTGPYGNLTGMRNRWGRQALIVKAGAYLYLIKSIDDGRELPWEELLKGQRQWQ